MLAHIDYIKKWYWNGDKMYITEEQLHNLRKRFPEGTLVELVKMDDIQAPPKGTKGRVIKIDDTGTIFCSWESGGSLGVVFGVDEVRILRNDDL